MLVDSHCHIDDEKFAADRDEVVERALAAGVEQMVVIGTGEGPPDLEAGIRIAEDYGAVLATVGVHPEYAARVTPGLFDLISDLLNHAKVIAIGEIGLDYHWDPSTRDVQQEVFIEQMRIARAKKKPIVIHTRDAWDDTFALLGEHWQPAGLPCVLHCFTGTPEQAQRALDMGFYLSFGGIVTYPKALEVQASAKLVPLDRMLVETDAPYLAPVPHRGKRNEPAFAAHTAAKIAELRGQPVELIEEATTNTFRRIFYGAK